MLIEGTGTMVSEGLEGGLSLLSDTDRRAGDHLVTPK